MKVLLLAALTYIQLHMC